jgi:hypothetical protein
MPPLPLDDLALIDFVNHPKMATLLIQDDSFEDMQLKGIGATSALWTIWN